MSGHPPTPPAERIFLGWDAPALPRAAALLADRYAGPRELDLRGVVVVTPGARAGRRLAELLLDEGEARGVTLTPPRIVTVGRLPELLYVPELPLADPTVLRLAYAQALQGVGPEALHRLFPEPPRDSAGWAALAGAVSALHGELGAEGLDFRDVGRTIREGFPYDDTERWETLAVVRERCLDLLRRGGMGDRDSERRKALEEGRLAGPGDLWLVGVAELPRVARRMVEALPGPVRALVHAPEEHRDLFDGLGCVVAEGWAGAHVPLDEDRVHVVQRPPDQADAVAEVLRGFGGRYPAEEIVVGVPDPELVPYVERGLAMVEVPHRFAGGTPLGDTGPFRLLEAAAEYLDGRGFPAFASLLRHPDLPGLPENIDPLTTADEFHTRHLPASVEGRLHGKDRSAEAMRALLPALEDALSLEGLQGKRPLSRWMPLVLDILLRAYGGAPLEARNPWARLVVESSTRIKDTAGQLAGLPRLLDTEMTAPEAIRSLLAELRGEAIPPEPRREAVELLGWLELPLDDAPAAVVAGFNDRHLPEVLGADPFLPGALRTHLGLPDDRARYARDAYLLSALLHSREEVHLVAGRLSAAGDPLRPSRLLFAAPDEVVARRILRFLGEEENGGRLLRSPGDRMEEAGDTTAPGPPALTGSRFRSPPENPLRREGPLMKISVTDFGAYLADPYRYALERVLELGPLDDEAREMDGGLFGEVAHVVLERFGRSGAASSGDAETVEGALGRILDEVVLERFGHRPVPAVRIQAEHLRARLGAFAKWQSDWVMAGWRVVCVERYSGEGVPFDVDGETVLLRGKIDRIDHHPESGAWAIFDYKTGDAGHDPEKTHRRGRGQGKEWVDLQLPLYRRLLAGVLNEDGAPVVPVAQQAGVGLGYIVLPRDLASTGAAMAEWDSDALCQAEETAREVIRAIRTGVFPYDPETRGYRDDPFDPLLGRNELPVLEESGEDGEEEGGA